VGRGDGHSVVAAMQLHWGPPSPGGLPWEQIQVPSGNAHMRSSARPGASEAGHAGLPVAREAYEDGQSEVGGHIQTPKAVQPVELHSKSWLQPKFGFVPYSQ
jgi:hypothetical protein